MKNIVGVAILIIGFVLIYSVIGNPGGSLNSIPIVIFRIFILFLACYALYQCYDSWRSAWLGIQPNTSAPDDDPTNIRTRAAGFLWGVIALALSLLMFSMWIFRWGPWAAFHGG